MQFCRERTLWLALLCLTTVSASGFLENWMGQLLPIIGERTILDLSLPGTHDTLTYDLSELVADGGYDDSFKISEILHLASELGIGPNSWIREQAQTQTLNITEQLNQGIRFLDVRNMLTSAPLSPKDWFGLHFLQTNRKAIDYLTEVKNWLLAHPTEVLVIWISKHGSECAVGNDQYPDVTIEQKQEYWASIELLFSGLLSDNSISPINQTSLRTLIQRNHRLIIYASDYVEFTNSSHFAIDGCQLDNQLAPNIDDGASSYFGINNLLQQATTIKQQDKSRNKFYLLSLASSVGSENLKYSFLLRYVPFYQDHNKEECAASYHIPKLTDWCPSGLGDIAHLANYYTQISLDLAVKCDWGFPNAIYIDRISYDGTIITGLSDGTGNQFAYADSILYMNVKQSCQINSHPECGNTLSLLNERRSKYPLKLWEDDQHGRLTDWPVSNPHC